MRSSYLVLLLVLLAVAGCYVTPKRDTTVYTPRMPRVFDSVQLVVALNDSVFSADDCRRHAAVWPKVDSWHQPSDWDSYVYGDSVLDSLHVPCLKYALVNNTDSTLVLTGEHGLIIFTNLIMSVGRLEGDDHPHVTLSQESSIPNRPLDTAVQGVQKLPPGDTLRFGWPKIDVVLSSQLDSIPAGRYWVCLNFDIATTPYPWTSRLDGANLESDTLWFRVR